jgi:hypothetical protein
MTNIPPNAWKLFAALSAFQKDYAVIGETATVFHLEERNAQSQRATVDLDMAILEAFMSDPASYFVPQRIRDSLWADYPDTTTRKTIKGFTPETFSNIMRTYFRNGVA